MLFGLLHATLRLRIDIPGATGGIERSRTGKLPLNLLCGYTRIVRMIFVEAFLAVADRRTVTGVGEYHCARHAFGRLNEKNGYIWIRHSRGVGTEIVASVILGHAPVDSERCLSSSE